MATINFSKCTVSNNKNSPWVHHDITCTSSRINNSAVRYNFNVTSRFNDNSSLHYINSGYELTGYFTVNSKDSSKVVIKSNESNWNGSQNDKRTSYSVTATSTAAGNQSARFRVISTGNVNVNAGTIDTDSLSDTYVVTAPALLYTNCSPPTAFSISTSSPFETNVAISWSGAKGGTNNSISSYQIQYTTNNGTSYAALANVTSTSTSGSGTYDMSGKVSRGASVKFRIRTRGSAGDSYYSSWKESGTIKRNSAPVAPTTVKASKTTFSQGDKITISWSGASDADNNINHYLLQWRSQTDGSYGSWATLQKVSSTSTSSSHEFVCNLGRYGQQVQFRVYTVDALGIQSSASGSVTITKSKPPEYGKLNTVYKSKWLDTHTTIRWNSKWKKPGVKFRKNQKWV